MSLLADGAQSRLIFGACGTYRARQVKRIAIMDFDAHHGNGTQDAFERDSRVLLVDVHQVLEENNMFGYMFYLSAQFA